VILRVGVVGSIHVVGSVDVVGSIGEGSLFGVVDPDREE
jgi:hypothetical protein